MNNGNIMVSLIKINNNEMINVIKDFALSKQYILNQNI